MSGPWAPASCTTGNTRTGPPWFGPESGSTQTHLGGGYAAVDLIAGEYFFTTQYGGCAPGSAQVTVGVGTTVMQDLVIDCP